MGGGTLQLLLAAKQEQPKTQNQPKLSFFKAVITKYSNFALEPLQLTFDFVDIQETESITFTCTIPKYSSLINNLSLQFTVPKITNSSSNDIEMKWRQPVMMYLLKSAELMIGTHVIETLTSEWIYIYYSIYASKSEKEAFENLCIEEGKICTIPLPFWFVRQKKYLPIQGLEYDSAVIRITIRPLNECLCVRKKRQL